MNIGQSRDWQLRHRPATKAAMIRSAESRRCPKCGRGAGLRKSNDAVMLVTTCRYCDYERSAWRI